MVLNCIMYIDLDCRTSDINRREFFRSFREAELRIKELEKLYEGDEGFYFDPKIIFRLEYTNTNELIEQLNLLNTNEGQKKLMQ